MEVLILGGDSRYLEIINHLNGKHNIELIGYKNIYIDQVKNIDIDNININKYDIIIFPINGVMENNFITCKFNNNPIKVPIDLLINTKKEALIFSGINTPCLNNMLKIANRNCTFLMNDKQVILQNAIPTVEGIIADVINNTEKTLTDSNILIFGYGNIGKLLVHYLKLLGANTSVGIILPNDQKKLNNINIHNFYTYDNNHLIQEISAADVIINTVPKEIITTRDLIHINKDAYILDISSHPHGINSEVLNKIFIKNKLYLGIPGKVAPKTSGKILTKKIQEIMEG